ncbi:MAG: glycosyltransferase family 2 protein [Sphingobacteriales bacterium]|nr:MAG: glycosyltransferase family 2 protein [Sphingobacteriales bacterium]
MDVSVIIVNYNTYGLIVDCIESVYKHTSGLQFEVILVDNASPNGFPADEFRAKFPEAKLKLSKENLGFAGGNNLGIAVATGKYILLLNSDTYLKENSLLVTYKYMEARPKAGVVSARLVYPDGRHQSVAQRFPSVKYELAELLRLQKFMSKASAGKFLLGAFFDHKENTTADWVWGAYYFFRSELLKHMPGNKLDETYFMYNEDIQWSLDIHRLGYEVHFCADTEVVHIMEGSGGKKSKMMIENGDLFLKKNFSPLKVVLIKKLRSLLHGNT